MRLGRVGERENVGMGTEQERVQRLVGLDSELATLPDTRCQAIFTFQVKGLTGVPEIGPSARPLLSVAVDYHPSFREARELVVQNHGTSLHLSCHRGAVSTIRL